MGWVTRGLVAVVVLLATVAVVIAALLEMASHVS